VAAASTTRTVLCGLTGGSPAGLVPAGDEDDGPTVGKRPDGSVDEVPEPGIAGSVTGGSVVMPVGSEGGAVTVDLGGATTTSVAEPLNESAELALGVAVSWTCSPSAAFLPTGTLTWSSSTCPTDTLPTLHFTPSATGHTVNFGVPMYNA
jgi:hypothetical protein